MNEETFVDKVAKATSSDERRAEALIFAVFQELRDRLTLEEAAHVAAQLPASLKMLWMSFDRPNRSVRRIHEAEFLADVRRTVALPSDYEAERAVSAVFRVLQEALGGSSGPRGEAWDVFSQLPKDLKRLWMRAQD